MGTVYRGTHVLMDKTVAVKVLRPSLAADEKIVARFSREARAASRISHPNALSVTDFGEDEGGIVFLVMEYLSGKTLKEVIRDEGPMPLARVVEITRQIGGALEAAHGQGVVHRDLKSENIMLLDGGSGDYAKVLDFGIAKIKEPEGEFDPGLTAPDLVIGTPQYMSPEQCSQSSDIDARSDIYSFGVILYEMLVGHVPFSGPGATTIMMMHLQEPAPSVLDERLDLPPSVGGVVARALAKLPDNRYQTIGDLIEDLTIAASMRVPAPASGAISQTNDAVSPSAPLAMDLGSEADEVTAVRPRYSPVSTPRVPITVPIPQHGAQPAPVSSFNPLKVIIPSAVALLVIFAVIYAFTKNSGSGNATNANQPQSTLAADPNSQPVQSVQPATGKSEEGIPSGGAINPVANVNANLNTNAAVSPTPLEDANASPTVNANANRKAPALPEPSRTVNPEVVPVPSPAGAKTPEPKPTTAAAVASPTEPPK
jgi:serine/threonine-protein kinase